MKLTIYLPLLVAALFAGCTADREPASPNADDTFTVSFRIPEMEAATRSLSENPNLQNLKLHVMVFDEKGSFIKHISQTDGSGDISNVSADGSNVTYNIRLPYSTAKRRVHFVASEYDLNYTPGPEQLTMSAMVVSDNKEAYWNMVEVASITDAGTKPAFDGIALVRNFCKISVTANTGVNWSGFVLVNQPTAGTVVPYIADNNGSQAFADYSQTTYEQIQLQGFRGWETASSSIVKQNASDFADSELSKDAKYIYERTSHKTEGAKASFVVVKANFSGKDYYYHIDLAWVDKNTGQAIDYDLLRNFNFNVNITSVNAAGYDTLQAAIEGSSTNNLSYDIKNQTLNTIVGSDNEALTVDYTNITFVKGNDDNELSFKYYSDFENKTEKNDTTGMRAVVSSNDKVLVDKEGNSLPLGHIFPITRENGKFKITYNVAKTSSTSKATIRIFKINGLGREVKITARLPLDFGDESHIESIAFDNTAYSADDFSKAVYPNPGITSGFGKNKGAPLNVYIKLPSDLADSMFPMVFDFESRYQLLYPNYLGELTTHSGDSHFKDKDRPTDRRTFFRLTLNLEDYEKKTLEAAGSKTILLVAPFLFSVSSTADSNSAEDKLLITNEYSNAYTLQYTR